MINKIISQIWDKIWDKVIILFILFIFFIIIFSIVKFILIIINFLITYYKDIWLVTKYIFSTIILPLAIIFLIISLFNSINLHFISKKLDSLKPAEKEKYIKKLSNYKSTLLLDYLIKQKDTKLIEFIINNKPKSTIKQNANKLISFFLKEKDYSNLENLFESINYDPYIIQSNSYQLISFFIKHNDYDMLCNFLDLMIKNSLNISNLFFQIFKLEYKYSLTINKVEDIENMLSKIKYTFSSSNFSNLPKTIAKELLDFVFYEIDDVQDYPIYPLKKKITEIIKNQNLLDPKWLLEYIPTLYGNYIMSCGRLDCEDIFKFIITNLLQDNNINYEKIENIRSKIIEKINQEDNKATIDAYKYFLYLFNQELNIFN